MADPKPDKRRRWWLMKRRKEEKENNKKNVRRGLTVAEDGVEKGGWLIPSYDAWML